MKCRTISTEHYETIPKLGSEFRHILNIESTSQTVSSQSHNFRQFAPFSDIDNYVSAIGKNCIKKRNIYVFRTQ